jgi:nucleoid-associated protein YejK
VKKIVPTDVHIYINEKKKKKKKQVQKKIKHLFDYQPVLIHKGEKPKKIVKKLSHPLNASKRKAFLEYKRAERAKKLMKKPVKKKLVKKTVKACEEEGAEESEESCGGVRARDAHVGPIQISTAVLPSVP